MLCATIVELHRPISFFYQTSIAKRVLLMVRNNLRNSSKMDFASRSGLVKRRVVTVVAAYCGQDWPKENKKKNSHIIVKCVSSLKQDPCHLSSQ